MALTRVPAPPPPWVGSGGPQVLHASPGPRLGGLLPLSFVAANGAAIWALGRSRALATLVNSGPLAAFLATVGAGLGSGGDMSGYNLALNGERPGVPRGCPAYEEVLSPLPPPLPRKATMPLGRRASPPCVCVCDPTQSFCRVCVCPVFAQSFCRGCGVVSAQSFCFQRRVFQTGPLPTAPVLALSPYSSLHPFLKLCHSSFRCGSRR